MPDHGRLIVGLTVKNDRRWEAWNGADRGGDDGRKLADAKSDPVYEF